MTSDSLKAPWYRRLAFQIMVFLSIALLPIGLISVLQTRKVAEEAEAMTAVSRLTITERAVQEERSQIAIAHGAAGALSEFADLLRADLAYCDKRLGDFVEDQRSYNFAAVVAVSGKAICSSNVISRDFSQNDGFRRMREISAPFEILEADVSNGQIPLITIFHPLFADGRIQDYIAISLPHVPPSIDQNHLPGRGLVGITTFDPNGAVLSATLDQQELITELPEGIELESISDFGTTLFRARNADGQERDYAAVPIVGQVVYALAIWAKKSGDGQSGWIVSPIVFPILMWLVSLIVAITAMTRLVVRHVRTLGRRMREFEKDRVLRKFDNTVELSSELIDIQQDFMTMAHGILHDEAHLEETIRSKNVLLKEVHHRVRNNLQLIASIMSIQIRESQTPEARAVVETLQERVLSLATVHQNVYQMQDMGRVDARQLLDEILQSRIEHSELKDGKTKFELNLDNLLLFPDQAVPLSLLVTEGLNNAFILCEPDENNEKWIEVTLKVTDNTSCELHIRNSTKLNTGTDQINGIASVLIQAFVAQLNGNLTVDILPHSYALKIEFASDEFVPETMEF